MKTSLIFSLFFCVTAQAQQPSRTVDRYIFLAEELMKESKHPQAMEILEKTIEDYSLTDYGKVVVYWDLFICYLTMNKKEQAIEFANRFKVIATYNFDDLPPGYKKRSRLEDRMEFVSVFINAHWMENSYTYARNIQSPFMLRSLKYIQLIDLTMCSEKSTKNIKRELVSSNNIFKTTITCQICEDTWCDIPQEQVYFYQLY